jgi:hypothetical protein
MTKPCRLSVSNSEAFIFFTVVLGRVWIYFRLVKGLYDRSAGYHGRIRWSIREAIVQFTEVNYDLASPRPFDPTGTEKEYGTCFKDAPVHGTQRSESRALRIRIESVVAATIRT